MSNSLNVSLSADDHAWYSDPAQWIEKDSTGQHVGLEWREIVAKMRQRGYPVELDRVIRPSEQQSWTGYRHTQTNVMVRRGDHPAPCILSDSGRAVGYALLEIVAFNLSRLAKREAARLNREKNAA